MSNTGLPFPTSNNAPLPVPGGYGGNYSGLNFGGTTGQPFPTMPAWGAPSFSGGNMGNLNSGLGFQWGKDYGSDIYNRLGTAFGKGPGQLLGNILSGGLYNPQVAAAFLNAQQPGIARGEAGVLGAFGDAGARFSSAAALGLGDFESQVQLNQQQTLAQLFEQSQNQELSLLQGLLPTLHQERADEGGTFNKILGGLETVAGAALLPFSGGASAGLMTSGLSGLFGGKGGGGFSLPGFGGNTGTFGLSAPSFQNFSMPGIDPQVQPTGNMFMPIQQSLQSSGGDILSNPWMVNQDPVPGLMF